MNSCLQCQSSFQVTDQDHALYDKISPVFNEKKFIIPEPTLCPDCRVQRRLAWRNERVLYKRSCDLTKKSTISFYPPESPYKVYAQDVWWSDQWKPLDYGLDFDFNRPFFDQFNDLLEAVPHMAILISHGENSDYCPHVTDYKDSYMCVSGRKGENLYYSFMLFDSRDSMDCYACSKSELCYECVNGINLYDSIFSTQCRNSTNLAFCFDCEGCSHCIGCFGLRHKEYYVFNQPVSKEEFEKMAQKLRSGTATFEAAKAKTETHFLKYPRRALTLMNNENVTGDHLANCSNVRNCFLCEDLQDCAYVWNTPNTKDCIDVNYSSQAELIYNSISNASSYQCMGNVSSWDVKNTYYSFQCFYSDYLFGCVGLKKNKYCILNRQYTKGDYEQLVPKIIEHMTRSTSSGAPTGEWGEFFPLSLSPFAYNETIAQEFFPLTQEQVVQQKSHWKEPSERLPDVQKIIPAKRLPDSIKNIPDDILNWAIQCKKTGRAFKIIPQELAFYRKMNLPVPQVHPDERHQRRAALLNPRKLWDRSCGKCKQPIQTTYSPDRPEIVYCEECYLKEVY